MKSTLCRNCILTAAVLVLPGCLAINAVLGVVGFMGSGPLQYAGTVYSVGEYTYEYAVNDKTPDEVIGEKLAFLSPEEEAPLPEPVKRVFAEDEGVLPKSARNMVAAELSRAPKTTVAALTPKPKPAVQEPQVVLAKAPEQPKRMASRPRTAQATKPPLQPAPPVHTYVEHTPDPLHVKLARLNQTLKLAEQVINHQPIEGTRYSVTNDKAGQTSLNGAWSIRHEIMQPAPQPVAQAQPHSPT